VLEDRMAHNGARALAFLEDLKTKTERRFREENRELLEFRRSLEGPDAPELDPWDVAYYAEKQRAALYDFDEEALRPYFPLEKVTAGLFDLVNRLYGIRVSEEPGVPVWDAQVRYYNIHDERRRVPGRLLHRLVSAREQARRRMDGCPDHRRSRRRRVPAAPGPDLRKPHRPGGWPAGAPHASRRGDHLPRVRPSAAPFA
jgi:Zn-dependent oligopeptidase